MTSIVSEPLSHLIPVRDRVARLLRSAGFKAVIGAHVIVAVIILIRGYGGLQPIELPIYDALRVAWAGDEPSNRIFLIGGTEKDIQRYDWPLKDGDLAALLERIAGWKPRVIGVDLYRDIPQPPGTNRNTAQRAPAQGAAAPADRAGFPVGRSSTASTNLRPRADDRGPA